MAFVTEIPLDNKLAARTFFGARLVLVFSMKNLISLLLGACLLFPIFADAESTDPTEPIIHSIRGKMVKIRVPAGFDRVTLQQYVVPRNPARASAGDRWRTLTTKYPHGDAMFIKVKMPTLIAKRFLRVYGNKVEKLPESLLTGISVFLPDLLDGETVVNSDGFGGVNKDGPGANGLTGTASVGDSATRTVTESDIWKAFDEYAPL